MALVLLVTLLTPWSHLYLRSLSDADRDETALGWFGPTYTVAKRIMEECTEFHSRVGGLTGFRLAPRQSRLDDTVYWAFGYFDFDFVGGDGSGRATVGVQHLKEIGPGDPLYPPRPESFVSRLDDQEGALPEALPFSIVVYPNPGDFFEHIECKSVPRSFPPP